MNGATIYIYIYPAEETDLNDTEGLTEFNLEG